MKGARRHAGLLFVLSMDAFNQDTDPFHLPDGLDFAYIGWIPCLSGSLCFDFLNPGIGKQRDSLLFDDGFQSSIIYADIDWKDSRNPEKDGKFSVVLFSQTNDSLSVLNGSAFICPQDIIGELWADRIKYIKANLEHSIEGGNQEKGREEKEKYFNPFWCEVSQKTDKELYEIRFVVDPYGFTRVVYNNYFDDSREVAATASRQAFYFIKYALHQHKHHPHEDDSLTTVFDLKNPSSSKELFNDLVRQVIRLKRHYDAIDYKDTKHSGIIAYSYSLLESLYQKGKVNGNEYSSNKNYLNNIEKSLSSLDSVKEQKDAHKQSAFVRAFQRLSAIIAALGIWLIGYRSLLGKSERSDVVASAAYEQMFSTAYGFAAFTILFIGLFLALWLYDTKLSHFGGTSRRFIKRIVRKMREKNLQYYRLMILCFLTAVLSLIIIFVDVELWLSMLKDFEFWLYLVSNLGNPQI